MLPKELKFFYEKAAIDKKSKRKIVAAKPNLVNKKNRTDKNVDIEKLVEVLFLRFLLLKFF